MAKAFYTFSLELGSSKYLSRFLLNTYLTIFLDGLKILSTVNLNCDKTNCQDKSIIYATQVLAIASINLFLLFSGVSQLLD